MPKIKVLFVCLGNICRSPMAEAVFQDLVNRAGLSEQFEIDSAGTGDWHIGKSAHRETLAELRKNDIEYSKCARQITRADLDDLDYILTMDDENLSTVKRWGKGRARVFPLLHFAPQITKEHGIREVPDPYFVGGFDGVFLLVKADAEGLLRHIRNEHAI